MSKPVTSNVVDGIQEAHGEGGDDDVDDDDDGDRYIREMTFSYYFDSVAEFVDWVKKTGRVHGCVISVQRSRDRSVELVCNRGGEPKFKATVRHTRSIKRGCPSKVVGRYNAPGGFWKPEVVNETHNHDPVLFEEGHPTLRKLTDEEIDMVATLHRQGLRPAKIKSAIKKSFPGNNVLENFLQTHGFTFYTRENFSTNRTENVFFCHEKSHTMWRAFPDLLLIDTTYNTNMYKWPFVQFVGVTSTSKSFSIVHAVIFREQECNFTWALERLKDMLVDCREPRVIVTDKDQALMNSCETRLGIIFATHWLVPYKEKFVSCWIDDRLNFGEHTRNIVEGQHANLKRYLSGTNNSLDSIAAFALEFVNSQMEEISATLEDSRVRIKKYHKFTLFEKLHNSVSPFAIAKLDKELTLLDTLQDMGASATTGYKHHRACRVLVSLTGTLFTIYVFH
ncbi:protein FAR1-RELATED SEQUENCE 2-like [Bidens hawaiensis]|uniref:protein FAR1-RELATED SEQUENCE 2-like n=1 Tax=Bidens hawaiensis TaxID=980011 RepID=UPI00404B091E